MKHYVGVDVSKSKLDIYLNGKDISVENNFAGLSILIEKLNEQIKQEHEIDLVYAKPVAVMKSCFGHYSMTEFHRWLINEQLFTPHTTVLITSPSCQ